MADHVALTGRDPERGLITGLLDDATRHGATLVIRGQPGVGKSALLEWAAATASDRFQILQALGTAAEFGFPFAGLHQILRPVLSHAIRLSRHRRDALDVAFGKASAAPPDLFSVAMAALDLLAEAATKKAVLVLADDVHWIDASSQQVLAFVGRRISSDRIVLLARTATETVGRWGTRPSRPSTCNHWTTPRRPRSSTGPATCSMPAPAPSSSTSRRATRSHCSNCPER